MPYDARYAAMSVRKRTYGNQGGTTGFMSRPFWDGAFFIAMRSKEAAGGRFCRYSVLKERKKMMKEKLQNIKEEALKAIESADMPEKLNDVRVKFLGKKGELTAVLKGMKDVAPEDRP